jgi:hypothetical protein
MFSVIFKLGFSPGRQEDVGLFIVAVFSFNHNSASAASLVASHFISYPADD